MSDEVPTGDDPVAAVAAWRAQAAAPVDAVGFAVLEALARRAQAQQGEVRRRLVLRIEALRTEQAASGTAARSAAPLRVEQAARRTVLSGLSEQIDRLGRSPKKRAAIGPAPSVEAARVAGERPAPRHDAVSAFQGTWLRLRAEQRLRQAQAQVPAMAGPLNSSHLVNRALRAMHDLSPAYLDAFLSSVDTLLWLEQAGDLASRAATSAERERKPGARATRKG